VEVLEAGRRLEHGGRDAESGRGYHESGESGGHRPCTGYGGPLTPCVQREREQGGTSKDGKVTLRTAECLAACGTAPVIQVDKKYYENLSIAEVDRILDTLVKDA